MRVLLTGGTGFIGSHLARALEARGDEVVVVSRRGPVTWDDVETRVSTVDAVVHLAGEPIADARWTPDRLERIRASRVDTTRRLARAIAAASTKPRVFVSGSAVGVYGMRKDDVACRESTPPGDDVLARMVVDWEAAAAPAREAGVRVAHPRTGIVLGPGGGPLAHGRAVPPVRRRTDRQRQAMGELDPPARRGERSAVPRGPRDPGPGQPGRPRAGHHGSAVVGHRTSATPAVADARAGLRPQGGRRLGRGAAAAHRTASRGRGAPGRGLLLLASPGSTRRCATCCKLVVT